VSVTGCKFADTSGSAISIGNVTEAILTETTQDSDLTITNNHIRDTGAEYTGCAGIVAGARKVLGWPKRGKLAHVLLGNTAIKD
jgi:hypothetical protein